MPSNYKTWFLNPNSFLKVMFARYKTVSFVVAYLMLLVTVLIANAILVSVFIGSVVQQTTHLPVIAEKFGAGLVYGAYSIAPYYVDIPMGGPRGPRYYYTIAVKGLHIVLVNPNPVPVEVVLLGFYRDAPQTFKVLDITTAFGIKWDNGKSPEGVEIVDNPGWFPDPTLHPHRALRMMPHTVVSFTVPSYYGEPSKLLACTPTGCVRLHSIGAMYYRPEEPGPWIIGGSKTPKGYPVVMQNWYWTAKTYGGPSQPCLRESGSFYCGSRIICCTECPSVCKPFGEPDSKSRGICEIDSGSVDSYSLVSGMPVNVIAGFYVTDPDFEITLPSEIRIGGFRYKIHGFGNIKPPTYSIVDDEWTNYKYQSCFVREVILTITVWAEDPETGKIVPFRKVWNKSDWIYLYVAAKGHSSNLFGLFYERDMVNITIYYKLKPDQGWLEVNSILATGDEGGVVDNSQELAGEEQKDWRIETDATGLKIVVKYIMEGPRSHPDTICFLESYSYLGPEYFCGFSSDRKIRLAFYVELIPSEYLELST